MTAKGAASVAAAIANFKRHAAESPAKCKKSSQRPNFATYSIFMKRTAFRMQLNPGRADEYRRRHDELWPEMDAVLREAGIVDYAIWLDEPTHVLFAVMLARDDQTTDQLPQHPVVRRWWDHMADVMAVNDDNSPVVGDLQLMFDMRTDESPLR